VVGRALEWPSPGDDVEGATVSVERDRYDREVRCAKNQSLFREINERVEDLHEKFKLSAPLEDWLCECANRACVETLALSRDEYEALRGEPRRFAVAASSEHVVADVEEVVQRARRYWVVEKVRDAGRVAEALDPRSRG
jgi:alpha-amylase/alpha-mannosidase (GH57 family)